MVDSPGLAGRLIEFMSAAGLTVRQLEERSRVNKDTIGAWRSGAQERVRVDKAERIAVVLGIGVEELLDLPPPVPGGKPESPSPAERLALLRRVAALRPAIEELRQVADDADRET